MLRNFILIAIRNFKKDGVYSAINISGLSIGIVCSILILLWVVDEVSFDRFIPKSDRLYQIWISAEFDGSINNWNSVPLPTYDAMKTANSNITNSVVTGWGGERLLTVGDTRIIKHGYYVSEEFLDMFEFPMVQGSREVALDDPLSIILSESLAKTLFGDEDPIGKTVTVEDQGVVQVTGIVKEVPENSTFKFDYLLTWKYREKYNEWVVENRTRWGNYSFQVFIELNDPSNAQEVEDAVRNMLAEHGEDEIKSTFFLHPMHEWRLYSNFDENGKQNGGRSDYVQLFSVIAIVILVMACINFMNLATARSEKRAREVGVRKSMGSNRFELIFQFIGESIFITAIAYIIAILLTEVSLPFFNDLVEKQLFIDYSSLTFWGLSIVGILLVGIVSGSYPAFYLSSFDPVKTLKGTSKIGAGAITPRKILVVLQFGCAVLLMISTIVIFNQIELVKNRDLGYNQESLISVELTNDLRDHYDALKEDLLQSGAVESMTRSNSEITNVSSNNFLGWPGKPEEQRVMFVTITAEYDYAKTMGIEVLNGRDFSKDFASDTGAIVVNQAALDIMGLEDPIGTQLDLWGEKRPLIGVVDNALMGSPYEPVRPMFVVLNDWGGYISVRLKKTNDLQASLATVEKLFVKHNPAYPFEYNFADVEFAQKFSDIALTQKLATIFSILSIIITGLGLFGLASYTAEQRVKEIGIRKVLGATVSNLMVLISKDFTKLVIMAFVLASPFAWYLLDQYLDRYTIRVDISWWIFPAVGIVILIFALAIVAEKARSAATANPVNSLRNE